ncbi:MAG: hypothetical protein WBY44_08620 [Bryobacteraceae bacterium]
MIDIQSWKEAVLKFRNARAAQFQTAERYLECSAGSVVVVGSRIERFRPGDAAFGDRSSLGFGGGTMSALPNVVAAEACADGFRTGGRAASGGRTHANHEGKVILTMV